MVLGLGPRFIGESIWFCFDLLYIMSFGRFGRKKDWSSEQNWKTWGLELPEFVTDIMILCIRVILQLVPLLQVAYPGLTASKG